MGDLLGTGVSFNATATLMAYVFILAPTMIIGFLLARSKRFGRHKLVMTFVVLANWVLIIALMIVSYAAGVAPGLPHNLNNIANLLPTIHLATGATAQLLATYLVILMWTEKTSLARLVPFRIKRIKTPMRLTLALWLITIALGAATYFVWYVRPDIPYQDAGTPLVPVVTEEAGIEPVTTEEAEADPDVVTTEEVEAENSEDETPAEPEVTEEPVGED